MAKSRRRSSKSNRATLKVLAAIATLILIMIVGAGLAFYLKGAPETEANDALTQLPEETPKARPKQNLDLIRADSPLERIILQHQAVTGVNQVESIKFEATLQMGAGNDPEKLHELIYYFRRPDLARRVMIHDGMRLDMGFDGKQVWAQQTAPSGATRPIENINERQKELFRNDVHVGSYLWRYSEESSKFHKLIDQNVEQLDGHFCHIIVYENDDITVTTYIDPETRYEIARLEEYKDGSTPLFMKMSDHQQTDGVTIPHRIETSVSGAVYSVTQITGVEINNGLPSYLFHEPTDRYTANQ